MQNFLALALLLAPHPPHLLQAAEATAGGPQALARLLERFDSLPEGAEKQALELEIDACAHQRYATVSRLYWHVDLDDARLAARANGKPILSLRMLGRLDEDYSCANSRFFRVVLYANQEVAAFLRENFVLHWSSERAVPQVTIDFGDGRTLRTTLAGNSVHYVLDSDGRPLDALPGLYSPVAFRRELEALLPLARTSPGLESEQRKRALDEHYRRHDQVVAAAERAARTQGAPTSAAQGIRAAERLTFSKLAVEIPVVNALGLDVAADQERGGLRLQEARLDPASRALVERLERSDLGAGPRSLAAPMLAALVRRFEQRIAADTEHNESSLRPLIQHILLQLGAGADLERLNQRVYAEVFLTPSTDPWLGLAGHGEFRALPGIGIVAP